jgi:hypothetical protein
MRPDRWQIKFGDQEIVEVSAFVEQEAVILAQAIRIKNAKPYENIISVIRMKD